MILKPLVPLTGRCHVVTGRFELEAAGTLFQSQLAILAQLMLTCDAN